MERNNAKRSAKLALGGLAIVSVVIWQLNGPHPIYVFGRAAVLWLFGLMLKGVFTPGFTPHVDEAQHFDAVQQFDSN